MKKLFIAMLLVLTLVIGFSVTVGAKEWTLGERGNLEATSYLVTAVNDLSDPALSMELAGEIKYSLLVTERLTLKVEDKLFIKNLHKGFTPPENALNIFAVYKVFDGIDVKGGVKFDNDWNHTEYIELKAVLF